MTTTKPEQNHIYITLIGTPRIVHNGVETTRFGSQRVIILLAYLLKARQAVSRRDLTAFLWPDKPYDEAHRDLSWALHQIGRLLPNCLLRTNTTAQLVLPDTATVDWLQLDTAIETEDMTQLHLLLNPLPPPLLSGIDVSDSAELQTWLIAQREQTQQLFVQGLHLLIAHAHHNMQWEQGDYFAQSLIKLDSWVEDGYRWRMDFFGTAGEIFSGRNTVPNVTSDFG